MNLDPKGPVPSTGYSIWYTEEGIRLARKNIASQDWAAKEWGRIRDVAERWVVKSDKEILGMVPKPGSIFCSGRNGTPCCGSTWLCQVDEPRKAACADCGKVYPDPTKGSPFHDEGHGFYHDGKWFAPIPVWNSFICSNLSTYSYGSGGRADNALLNLGLAYALTGDSRFGEKALLIYDALATLSPTTLGPLDIPEGEEREMGRMQSETCHVKRQNFLDVQIFDLLGGHPAMKEPSPTRGNDGLTIRENIIAGVFDNDLFTEPGARSYDYRGGNLRTLQNHELDGYRALLGVGLATGRPELIAWSGRALEVFLKNVIGRDGGYYENSEMYAYFSGTLFQDHAEFLAHYDPQKYDDPGAFPTVEGMLGIENLFDHPRVVRICVEYGELVRTCGRIPSYGNTNALQGYWPPSERQAMASHWSMLERLYFRTDNEDTRKQAEQLLLDFSDGDANRERRGLWALFNTTPGPTGASDYEPMTASSFAGHKGVVILRGGEGDRSRALMMRGGSNLLAQDDQLALFLYDRGRMVVEDVGYALAGSQVHNGWGMRAISHAMVTVNEDIPTSRGYEFVPSASLVTFEDFGDVKVAEYSGPISRAHQEATEYRRVLAFCDVDDETSYGVDLFLVAGGRIHDYALNGPKFFEGDEGSASVAGPDLQAREGAWTLAALGTMDGSEEANASGKSWGERIGPNDRIQGVAEPDGTPLPYGWTPPPGNGYAFIHDLKMAELDRCAFGEWRFGDEADTRFCVWLPPDPGATLIHGLGPDLKGTQQIHRLLVRHEGDEGLESLFIGVLGTFSGAPSIEGVDVLLRDPAAGTAAVRIRLADGREDTIVFSRSGSARIEEKDSPAIDLEGRLGIVRTAEGEEPRLCLAEGTRLRYGQHEVTLPAASFEARILEADPEDGSIVLDQALLEGMALEDRLCRVGETESDLSYSHDSAYRVVSVENGEKPRLALLHGDFRLSGGTVEEIRDDGVVISNGPLAFGWGWSNKDDKDKGEFRGKVLRSEDGTFQSRIVELFGFKEIRLESAEGLKPGMRFDILDVTSGDRVSIPNSISR